MNTLPIVNAKQLPLLRVAVAFLIKTFLCISNFCIPSDLQRKAELCVSSSMYFCLTQKGTITY